MATDVIVLNGGSSSGTTSLARCLQGLLDRAWLLLGVDDLVDALPPAGPGHEATIAFAPDGAVLIGAAFRRIEDAWVAGVAAMARTGVGVIVDDVFLGGADSQRRLGSGLQGLDVLWVGVHCDPAVAAAREAGRADRVAGMAASQAGLVHRGVVYDLEVDTSGTVTEECARSVLAAVVQQ